MRNLHHASLALALSLAMGCAPSLPKPPPVDGRNTVMDAHPTSRIGTRTFSKWRKGDCSFDSMDNMLSYSSTSPAKIGRLRLDEQVEIPERLLCSEQYSVLLNGNLAVVSLGAEGVISGREFIGQYGERFTFANSYHIDISDQNAEGVESSSILASTLVIETKSGRRWSIDLSDPQEWSISGPKAAGSRWQDVYSPLGRSFYISR